MARIIAAITRVLGSEYREPQVHFHAAHDARRRGLPRAGLLPPAPEGR